MTYDEMINYCKHHRESDGFCSVSSSCSGPCRSNLLKDDEYENAHPGVKVYSGGRYGSCKFYISASED